MSQALPLGLTDTRIISTCTLTSVGGLVIGDSMDADIVQQVVEPHHMTRDKNHNQRSHMTHDKGHTLNVGNVQRLSLLESWRQHYAEHQGDTCMKLEQNRAATEVVVTDDCDIMYHNRIHGTCSNHGSFTELDPMVGYDSASLKYTPLPVPAQLTLQSSSIPGEALGVFSTVFISKGVRMGPYEGRRISKEDVDENSSIAYAWEVQHKGNKRFVIDGADPTHSNWMRYVKCARHVEEQNLAAYQCHGNIYYCALRNISPKSELLVWYEDKYAKSLGVSLLSEAVISKFYCQGCGESFMAKKSFHVHLKHSSSCSYTCKSSNNHVSIQDQIKQLEAVVHHSSTIDHIPQFQSSSQQTCKQEQLDKTEPVTFVCPYCAEHVDHYCYHKSNPRDEQLTCKNCGNSFSQGDVWHQADHVYSCDHCDKQFSQKKALNLHLKTHSSGQNQCSLCGKMFTRTSNLQRHMRIHSGDRPYSCEHCDKAFRSRSNLQQHLVTHSTVKPFKCEFCAKSFGRVNNLQRHLRIHTGDRPYKCTDCDKSFIQSSHLRKHSRTHVAEKS